jgi:hypothetical protein
MKSDILLIVCGVGLMALLVLGFDWILSRAGPIEPDRHEHVEGDPQ